MVKGAAIFFKKGGPLGKAVTENTSRSGNSSVPTVEGRSPKGSRIPYHADPDYTKLLLEIPADAREQMLARLRFLCGEDKAAEALPDLERILRVYHAHKSQELIEAEKDFDPKDRFTEKDIVLQVKRYLASGSIALVLQGVPAIAVGFQFYPVWLVRCPCIC
jgi:hypothetical protein